jgi:hypothetical protein
VDDPHAAIVHGRLALDEPGRLELVDEPDDLARRNAGRPGQVRLGHRAAGVEHPQDHPFPRLESERSEPGGPAPGRFEAELGHEEADPRGGEAPRGRLGRVVGHRSGS